MTNHGSSLAAHILVTQEVLNNNFFPDNAPSKKKNINVVYDAKTKDPESATVHQMYPITEKLNTSHPG